jgi:transketolase
MTHNELSQMANTLREDIVKMLVAAGSGHSAGPLGLADIFAALYFDILKHDPKDPTWLDRDRLILSSGHCVPVRYAAMARSGYFPVSELATLRKYGSRLQGHPERLRLPGLESTSGPLGSGISQAAGMAIALRMDGGRQHVYCVTGDGELDEGNIWEAIMFVAKERLTNLTVIVDRNNIQIDGPTETVMPLGDLAKKFSAFGWHVIEIDGNNIEAVINACDLAKAVVEAPTVIIAHTVPGKGVDYMEYDYRWHGVSPNLQEMPGAPKRDAQAKVALAELRTLGGQIRSEHE